MGMFDYVHTGTRCGQTKAFFRTLSDLAPGTRVGGPDGWYAMSEGGWLVVSGGMFVAWVDDDPARTVARFDSMGRPIEGALPEDHGYEVKTREEVAARIQRPRDLFGNPEPVTEDDVEQEWLKELASSAGFPHSCEVCAELLSG
jgi:hypothetical protein